MTDARNRRGLSALDAAIKRRLEPDERADRPAMAEQVYVYLAWLPDPALEAEVALLQEPTRLHGAIKIERLAPWLMVLDMPRSIAFYRDVLGFDLGGTSQPDGVNGYVERRHRTTHTLRGQ